MGERIPAFMRNTAYTRPKVAFIIPRVRTNPFSILNSIPVGPLLLATSLKKKGFGVGFFNEGAAGSFSRRGRITHPGLLSSDIVCVSVMTPNADRGYFYADRLRQLGKKVIIGGIHASVMAEEALRHADCVVKGEGENVISGAADMNGIVDAGVVENMDSLDIPDISLAGGNPSIIERFYGLSIPFSTIRGCPFKCDFCSVGNVYGKKARRMRPERVGAEIDARLAEGYAGKRRFVRFFCCDDTYSLFKEERKEQHEIIRMIQRKRGASVSLCVQDRADMLYNDEKYIKNMSGIVRRVMLGIEQMDDKFLKSHNKGIRIGQIKETVRLLHKHGVGIHAFCMISPDTTEATLNNTLSFLAKSGIQTAQFTMLTPLPGTELYERTRDLLVKGWENYNTLTSVFRDGQERFRRDTARMYARFYSLKKILAHAFRLETSYFLSSLYGRYLGHKIFAAGPPPVKK